MGRYVDITHDDCKKTIAAQAALIEKLGEALTHSVRNEPAFNEALAAYEEYKKEQARG